MTSEFVPPSSRDELLPLWLVTEGSLERWLDEQSVPVGTWVRAHTFQAERHRVLPLPRTDGSVGGAVLGLGPLRDPNELKLWHVAGLSERLPPLPFRLATPLGREAATHFTLGWLVGSYRYSAYRTAVPATRPALAAPEGADLAYARAAAGATSLARDLINAPANDLGPAELAQAAIDLAGRFAATCRVLVGAELEQHGFPLLHAVGRGSPREPRLIDVRWGSAAAPR